MTTMKITVICTTITTKLTITVPSGSGPVSLEKMPNGVASTAPPSFASGTTTPVKVGPGAYKIVGDNVTVAADPSTAGQVQIATVSKTDPPELVTLALAAAPFTQAQLNAFVVAGKAGSLPPLG